MMRSLTFFAVVACGCNQPVEGLDDTLRGCFVTEEGSPAANVPVFLVRDDVAERETRTGPAGCFTFENLAPGRWVVAAHDFQGHGLLEALHDVDGQFRPLGQRTLASLRFDARWSALRGVGLAEVLAPATTTSTTIWCDATSISTSDRGALGRLDVRSGALQRGLPAIEVEARPPGPGRRGFPDEVVALRWTRSRETVPLPEGTDSWVTVTGLTESAFLASAGLRTNLSTSLTTWVYGAAGQVVALGRQPCRLVSSGSCVREEGRAGVKRWNPDGTVTALGLSLGAGEDLLWLSSEPRGERVLVVHRRAGGLVASVRRLDGTLVAESPLGGDEVEPLSTGAVLPNFWSFFTTTAGGERRWVRVGVERGEVAELPAPVRPTEAVDVPATGVGTWAWPRLEWMERDGDAWVVTVVEHTPERLRRRSLRVPFLLQPDFSKGTEPEGIESFAGFSLASVPDDGLEVVQAGERAMVLEAGAALDSGRPFALTGLAHMLHCTSGRFVVSRAWSADVTPRVVVLDVARVGRELGVRPAPP